NAMNAAASSHRLMSPSLDRTFFAKVTADVQDAQSLGPSQRRRPVAYWLLKTEPEEFSWDDQVKRGAKGEAWTGVRNFRARGNLKEMKKGDHAFFYHTGEEKQIVGIVEVIREAYPDPTDPKGIVCAVDVVAVKPFATP